MVTKEQAEELLAYIKEAREVYPATSKKISMLEFVAVMAQCKGPHDMIGKIDLTPEEIEKRWNKYYPVFYRT
jgi:hypothetical protein